MEKGIRARLSAALPYTSPSILDLRKFGLLVGGVTAGLFGLVPILRHHPARTWPWVVGAVLAFLALALPGWLRRVHRLWMALGAALGWVNLRIILSAVFVVLLTPLALAARMAGRDTMGRRITRGPGTYRRPSVAPSRERMTRPF